MTAALAPVRLASVEAAVRWLADRVGTQAGAPCGTLRSDSRQVQPGDAFIAWPGHVADGRQFVAAALAAGAAACLVEEAGSAAFDFRDPRVATLPGLKAAAGPIADGFFGQPSARLHVVAATGTNGKTSSTWWIAQALGLLGQGCGIVGTLGVGSRSASLVPTGLTTPDPVTLQAALRGFADGGLAACALEASSIGLVEHRLAGTRIEVALLTNFSRDHLDFHGSMAAYWQAKRALFDWPGLRAAVLNIDDAQGAALAGELEGRLALWTVSASGAPARLRASGLRHDADGGGLAFTLHEGDAALPVASPLIGDYNAANLLGVIAALRALGVPLADAVSTVPKLTPVPGRLQRVDLPGVDEPGPSARPPPAGGRWPSAGTDSPQGLSVSGLSPQAGPDPLGGSVAVPRERGAVTLPQVVVDYAHTPDALDKVLRALRPLATARGGRLWCVFGCGGNRDASKRPLMGAIAGSLADRVVLTSDNPRQENPCFILSQVLAGVVGHSGVDVMEDRRAAIADAVRQAAAADVILIAGKGHEDYQEVAGVRHPFSDAVEALAALRARAGASS